QDVHLLLNEVDRRGALCWRGGRDTTGRRDEVARGIDKGIVDDAVDRREIALYKLEIGEVKKLVFPEGAAQAAAGLVPPFGSVDTVGVAVGSVQRAVAEEPIGGAV